MSKPAPRTTVKPSAILHKDVLDNGTTYVQRQYGAMELESSNHAHGFSRQEVTLYARTAEQYDGATTMVEADGCPESAYEGDAPFVAVAIASRRRSNSTEDRLTSFITVADARELLAQLTEAIEHADPSTDEEPEPQLGTEHTLLLKGQRVIVSHVPGFGHDVPATVTVVDAVDRHLPYRVLIDGSNQERWIGHSEVTHLRQAQAPR